MTAFGIKTLLLRPTLTLYVDFGKAPGATLYTITAQDRVLGTEVVTATAAGPPASLPALAYGRVYDVTVTAGDDTTAAVELSTTRDFSRSGFVRQRLWEIIEGAAITLEGKRMHVFADAYGRPRVLNAQDAIASRLPACEVGQPRLIDGRLVSIRSEDTYETGIRVFVGASDPDQGLERAQLMAERVREAIDRTSMLGMIGVHNGAWQWTTRGEPEWEKNVVALELVMRLTVQGGAGRSVYAA